MGDGEERFGTWLADALRRLLGESCLGCGERPAKSGLCAGCRAALPRLPESVCAVCAEPVFGADRCGACVTHPPAFVRTVAARVYTFPLDAWIRALKYRGHLPAARALAGLLADALRFAALPDLLIPMPLSPARQRERGFNQALEIARQLPPHLAGPLDTRVLLRARDTEAQAALSIEDRRRNVKGAFRAVRTLSGARVALLDDVMTTGATADAAASALREAGAAEVSVWVVARALR
jgi:ComF family protein